MNPDFEPHSQLISDVSTAVNAVVTTVSPHGFETDYVIRIFVPARYGMNIEYVQTKIMVIDETSFTTQIDTTALFPFVTPTYPPGFTQAQAILMTGVQHNVAEAFS